MASRIGSTSKFAGQPTAISAGSRIVEVDIGDAIVTESFPRCDRWSRASLRILGEDLQPGEIEVLLDLKATRTHSRAESRTREDTAIWLDSLWLLESPLPQDCDLPEHLDWLLDALEPKLYVLSSLSRKYRVDLFCGFSSSSGQGGFTLDNARLSRIARLGVPMVLDLYPPQSN
jgi:hypothetical protein